VSGGPIPAGHKLRVVDRVGCLQAARIAQPRFVVIVPGFGGDRKRPRQKWPTALHLAGVKLVRVEQKRHAIPRDEQAMPRVGLE
jgi:hypothetical protein